VVVAAAAAVSTVGEGFLVLRPVAVPGLAFVPYRARARHFTQ
jgi:hypothetical protein